MTGISAIEAVDQSNPVIYRHSPSWSPAGEIPQYSTVSNDLPRIFAQFSAHLLRYPEILS